MTTAIQRPPAQASRPGRSGAFYLLAGMLLIAAGGLGVMAVTVPGRARIPSGGWYLSWRYPPDTWLWAVALIAAGVLIAAGWRRAWAPHVAAPSAVIALMLAGQAGVGIRDWFNVAGAGSISLSSLANVVTIAAACCVISLAAAAAAAIAVLPQFRLANTRPGRGLLVAATVITCFVPALPFVLLGEPVTATGFGSVLLPWALPWAAGLLAARVATQPIARILILTISASAVCTVGLHAAAAMTAR